MTPGDDPTRVACVLMIIRGPYVLAVERDVGTDRWGLPGGHARLGETFADAARRECLEETGIDPGPLDHVIHRTEHDGLACECFYAGVVEPQLPRASDEGRADWLSADVLADPETNPFAEYFRAAMKKIPLDSITLDLGVGDVHVESAGRFGTAKGKTLADLNAKTRAALPADRFADPARRRYPIENKAHADNALSRLEANKANEPNYAAIKARIVAAQKRFGEVKKPSSTRRVSVRASIPVGGHLSVRHMADTHCPGVELATVELGEGATKQVWIQLARPGRFFKDGPFTLDEKVFADIIRNFNATVNHTVPVDFEHATEQPAHAGTIPMIGAPAQGWIKAIEMRGENLFGLVEWGALAKDYIKSGAYKYISPAIRFGAPDKTTGRNIGARLTSAALTNKPFLDGMAAVAASDAVTQLAAATGAEPVALVQLAGTSCYSSGEFMPQVRACLKMADLSTAQECKDQLGRIKEHLAAAGGDHEASPQGVPIGSYLRPLRDMVGAKPGTTWDDVFAAVEAMIDAAIEEHEAAYHAGQEPTEPDEAQASEEATATDDATPTIQTATDGGSNEESNMEAAEITKQLTDAKAQVITLTEKVASLSDGAKVQESAAAGLTLKLKDAESKVVDGAAKIAELEKANKELTEKLATVATQRLTDKVETAFATYKDAQKLTEAHKKMMMLTLRDEPATFEELYPAIDPSKRHLLRDVTPNPEKKNLTEVTSEIPDVKTLTDKHVAAGKSIEEAVSLAYGEVRRALNGSPGPAVTA